MPPHQLDKAVVLYEGDCLSVLKRLPSESVHCVITSPPYWGLRDYGTGKWEGGAPKHNHDRIAARGGRGGSGAAGKQTEGAFPSDFPASICSCGARYVDPQLGLEPTLAEHVAAMVKVFREARRVLRSDGTLWLNYGDSYATAINGRSAADTKAAGNDDRTFRDKPFSTVTDGLKPKDLCGVPWRVAFALQADGWWLRSDIIWSKPNPMPESITDRPAKAHEYVFLFTKSARYFYDAEAVKESGKDWSHSGPGIGIKNTAERYGANNGGNDGLAKLAGRYKSGEQSVNRNRRSVWEIPTAPFPGAHFATFPPKLVAICLQAGTSERGCCAKCGAPWKRHTETDYKHHEKWFGDKQDARHSRGTAGQSYDEPIGTRTIGWSPSCSCNADVVPCTVLDPFGGSGTVGAIAKMFGRQAVLIELNAKYRPMIKRRIQGLREPADMTQGEPKESSLFGEQDVVIQAQRAAAKTRNGRPGRSRS